MDATAQWPQGIGVVKGAAVEKKPRPHKEEAVNCPRCSSTNTKFCYYNNYSLSQPRYFCKTCRRYWTEGGSLRNVPVGGGSRKNKRPSSSNPSSSSPSNTNSSKKILPQDQIFSPQNPKIQHGHDLNLAYNPFSQFVALPFGIDSKNMILENPNFSTMNMLSSPPPPAASLSIPVSCGDHGNGSSLYSNNNSGGGHNSNNNSSVFANFHHDHLIKPTLLGFSLDGLENGSYGNLQGLDQDQDHNHHHSSHVHDVPSSKMLFPFEELKTDSRNDQEFDDHQQQQEINRGQNGDQSNGYWTGMLAGGSW